jgi:VRR-NUC domain
MRVTDVKELPEWAQKQIGKTLGLPKAPLKGTPRKQLEKVFMAEVTKLAGLTGWLYYHTYDSRRSSPGFPDLVMVKPPRVIFAELKSTSGKLSAKQSKWKDALEACPGISYYLWTPQHWQEITHVLQAVNDGT